MALPLPGDLISERIMPVLKILSTVLFILCLNLQITAQEVAEIPFHNLYVNAINEDFDSGFSINDNDLSVEKTGKKSVGKAIIFSLLIPGSGEWYMGASGQASFFFGVEVLLWGGLFANKWYAGQLQDDYKTYAVQYADVERDGKDKYYWINIGKYDNILDFNEQRARERYFEDMYTDIDKYNWNWQSKSNRLTYDGKRLDAESVDNNEVYFYSAIVLNHLVSGINALRLARKHNKTLSWRFDVDTYVDADHSYYYGFSLSKRF